MCIFFSYRAKGKKGGGAQEENQEGCNGNKIDSLSKLRWHFPFPVNYGFNYMASCDSLIPNKPDSLGQPSWFCLNCRCKTQHET